MAIRAAGAEDLAAVEAIVAAAYERRPPIVGQRPEPMDADYAETPRGDGSGLPRVFMQKIF